MAKISVKTRRLKDIGKLDRTVLLPTSGRKKIGMKTICDRCRKPITDEYFVAGFKKGLSNMKFHEKCVERGTANDIGG